MLHPYMLGLGFIGLRASWVIITRNFQAAASVRGVGTMITAIVVTMTSGATDYKLPP